MQQGVTRRRFLEGAATLGAGAMVTLGARPAWASAKPSGDSEVYPTGAPISPDYPFRGPNAPLDWFLPPEFVDIVGAQVPVYFGNVFSPDALELMAAIHGGTAEDYWRPVRWDFDAAQHTWMPTFLVDPYPASYPSTGRSYPGGGHILLKATNQAGSLTSFDLGSTPGYLSWSLEIGANCVLEGEVLDQEYETPKTLAGKPRTAEMINGLAGIAVNFFRIDRGAYIGAATEVELRNLVVRNCGMWPVAVYGAPWMSEKIDFTAENVHVVDLWTPAGEGGGFLGHNNAGSFRLHDCSAHVRHGTTANLLAGALFSANDWTTDVDVEITDCEFVLPSLPFGSAGVVIAGGSEELQGHARAHGNSIEADIGFEVVGDWVGDIVVANNPGPSGYLHTRKIGCLFGTTPERTNLTIEKNRFQMDRSESAADLLPLSAGLLGWEYSYTSMILAGFEAVPVPSHAVVRSNEFTGEADVGIAIGGPNAANVAEGNVFVGNNLSRLETVMDVTYAFSEDTANNVVTGYTGGSANVIEGNETNVFTGPGFRGLGPEAAAQLAAAMSTGGSKQTPDADSLVRHNYRGPHG